MTDLKLVALPVTNLRDVPATLRQIAENIEAGKIGVVDRGVVVTLGQTLEVFSMGDEAMALDAAALLHAGAHRMTAMVANVGRSK